MSLVTKVLIVVLSGIGSAIAFWVVADRLEIRGGATLAAGFLLGFGVQLIVAVMLG